METTVTRRAVLEALAASSDAESRQTVSLPALARALRIDETTVRRHLRGLIDCELAVQESEAEFRVSVTGEEFLALDLDEGAVIDPVPESER